MLTWGIQRLSVELDCLMAVQVLNNELESTALLDLLVCEIRKFQGLYAECQFQHVYREGNRVAYILARFTWNVEDTSIW